MVFGFRNDWAGLPVAEIVAGRGTRVKHGDLGIAVPVKPALGGFVGSVGIAQNDRHFSVQDRLKPRVDHVVET